MPGRQGKEWRSRGDLKPRPSTSGYGTWPSASVSPAVKWGKSVAASWGARTSESEDTAHRSCEKGSYCYCPTSIMISKGPRRPRRPPQGLGPRRGGCGRRGRAGGIQTNRPPLCCPQLPFTEDKPGLHFRVSISATRGWRATVSVEMRTKNFLPMGSPGCGPDGRAASAK